VITITGRCDKVVAPADVSYSGITFSRGGDFIHAVRVEGKDLGSFLYKIPVSGGEATRLVGGAQGPVTFSPDGRQIAFVRSLSGESTVVVAKDDGTGGKAVAVRRVP